MILITGATGIVGSHILMELLKKGEKVRVLKRKNASTEAIDQLLEFHKLPNGNIEYAEGDINDIVSLDDAAEGCHTVYHAAALVSFRPADADLLFQVNITGTKNVVDACINHGINTLAYISSTAAVGDELINGMQSEASKWTDDKGKSHYRLSKHYAEREVWRGAQEGLNVAIVNPTVVIGPVKWGQSSTTLLVTAKKGLKFSSTGSNGFVDARDIAEILVDLVAKKVFNQRFLLVGEHVSFTELFTRLGKRFGQKPPSIPMPKGLVLSFAFLLARFERIGISFPGMTSENMKSAFRNVTYDTAKIKALGYNFRSLDEAFDYTSKAQRIPE
jgi:dihydroflavonol-4-reductase